MDGIQSNVDKLVMVMATTNKPWDLDEAIRRRFEKRIYISLPNVECRVALFHYYLDSLKIEPNVSIDRLAQMTEKYSCSDIKSLCKDISMMPIRNVNLMGKTTEEIKELVSNVHNIVITKEMMDHSLQNSKATININEIVKYDRWNHEFGSI